MLVFMTSVEHYALALYKSLYRYEYCFNYIFGEKHDYILKRFFRIAMSIFRDLDARGDRKL